MANIRGLLICSLLLSALASSRALCAEYTLMPSPATVHIGNFNAALKAVLTINSGDIVTIETAATAIESEAVDHSGVVQPSMVGVAVDYHVTQVVDGTKGIHGMIPKAIFGSQ
jgi:acetamidase/formamidase